MADNAAELAPTSSAATRETEPQVVAAISSAKGNPDQPTGLRSGGLALGAVRSLVMLAAGLALGYGAARWLRARG